MFRALLLLLFVSTASAQSYPNKPIRWIVPYTGGGITDVVTRIVTQKMSGPLGQPVVVDNRPGANSILGSDLGAKAAPDGYTMLTVIAGYAANVTLYQGKLPFDPLKDLVPVSLAGIAPLIMTVNNNLPAKDVKELIAYAKANPGKLNFGSSGIGAAAHLTCELFKQTAGIDMVHIPFKGTAPATTAVMAGDIQILVDTPSSMMTHVRGGKLRALGMFSAKRLTAFPDVPTIARPADRRSSRRPGCCSWPRAARRSRSSTASPPRRARRSTNPKSRIASPSSASSRSATARRRRSASSMQRSPSGRA
jgi:tripartite-type tricarboxylate transporter receptor subunit TctC